MKTIVFDAIRKNEKSTFMELVRGDESVLTQRAQAAESTVLHVAAMFGREEIVEEILKLSPDLVAATDSREESPLHVACRAGNAKIVMCLLQINPNVAFLRNRDKKSAFYEAYVHGRLEVVKILVNQTGLLDFEGNEFHWSSVISSTSVSDGYTEIVRIILEKCPELARKCEENGLSPLHLACTKGLLWLTKILLKITPDIAVQFDGSGKTPLHLATMNDYVNIVEEFLSEVPSSFLCLTKDGENVCHLAARFKSYDTFVSLAKAFHGTALLYQPNVVGDTVLHLAVSACSAKVF